MESKQIKAICDAVSCLSIMDTADKDALKHYIDVHSKILTDAKVDKDIIKHFNLVAELYMTVLRLPN